MAGSLCFVIAAEYDLHADAVVDKIGSEVNIIGIDPLSALPRIGFDTSTRICRVGEVDFLADQVSGVFCRFALETFDASGIEHPNAAAKFAAKEHYSAFQGVLLQIPAVKWMNFPWRESIAEGKIYPLLRAAAAGFAVPDFVVTSDRDEMRRFHKQYPAVIKPLSDMSIARQDNEFVEIPKLAAFEAPYTVSFNPALIELHDGTTPSLIQKKIGKRGDLRVTIVDNSYFAAFLAHNSNHVDSRLVKDREESRFELDDAFAKRLVSFITHDLRLRFAAVDIVLGVDGEFYIVDINPSGNWLWMERDIGFPISDAVAAAVIVESRRVPS